MKISIVGTDTLAAAVAECCAEHFDVFEGEHGEADVIWICHDTPIDKKGVPDSEWVLEEIRSMMLRIANTVLPLSRPLMLVSSQMPVGTTAKLEKEFPAYRWAYSPENLRVATAVQDFRNAPRVVVGTRHPETRPVFESIFSHFTKHIIFTDPETAEMVKHALNTFLGLQIAYINEVARIAHVVGADMDVVTAALRSDSRVSPKAPLLSGKPFGGGHLARDIWTLDWIAVAANIKAPIIASINESNES
jgi:UDPglucose 6-dehydrogenase